MNTAKLYEFVDINPEVRLTKGKEYPCVMMEDITPGWRYVTAEGRRAYKGGSRFRMGDVLFARITPCLENGKIAQYVGREDGFGSTEFFIFRQRDGISDQGYIFYLALSDIIRKPAEKSFYGVSGRQRADLNVVKQIDVPAPSLPIQRKIAAVLSAYDDLIENNTRRIRILEQMAQAVYREWFGKVDARGRAASLPEGWLVAKLGDACNIVMGQSPESKYYNENGEGLPFHQGVTNFGDRYPTDRVFCTVENRIAEKGDILFSVRAPVGRLNIANKRIVIGRGLSAIRSKTGNQTFVFQQLKEQFQEVDTMGGGTIFKSVTKDDVLGIKFLLPPKELIAKFEDFATSTFRELEILTAKNANLRRTRDLLLPRLVSGEIDVSEMEIVTGER